MKDRVCIIVLAWVVVAAFQGVLLADQLDYVVKWSQPYDPTYPYNQNIPSYIVTDDLYDWEGDDIVQIAVDDWLCSTPQPMTDIHWWGGHILGGHEVVVPDGFAFAVFEDVPVGANNPDFSHPGEEPIWMWQTTTYDEVYITENPRGEPVFQYFTEIERENWFWQEDGDHIYWLAVAALFETAEPAEFGGMWGWATRPHYFQDDGVIGYWEEVSIPGTDLTEMVLVWDPLEDPDQNSMDLAFELSTVPEPTTLLVLATGILALGGVVRRRLS